MQETSVPPDAGFVVDWQLNEGASVVIDLSTAEAEVILPADPQVRSAPTPR